MPNSLRSTLDQLAHSFANGVLTAIRGASLQELLGDGAGARRRPSASPAAANAGNGRVGPGTSKRSKGRLARRSPEDVAKTLEAIVRALRATRGKGLRSEEIRKQLGLDVRELPRVLHVGLATKKLRSKGQKRATTYFAA